MSKLMFVGEIRGSFENSFKKEDKETITKKLQFIEVDKNGKIEVLEVKLNENQDMTKLVKGVKVQIEVKLFSRKDSQKVYLSQVKDTEIITK